MIWYNTSTMPHPTPIDISNIPELVRIAEVVEATKTPRELKRQNKTVAVIMLAESPMLSKKHTWEQIQKTFGSWNDVDADTYANPEAHLHAFRQFVSNFQLLNLTLP